MRMNKKSLTLLMIALAGVLFVTVSALTAADNPAKNACDVPDEVTIQNEGYKKDKKGPVKLSHNKHADKKENKGYEVACTECHHEYKDKKNVWKEADPVKKCSECHNPLKKEDNVIKLQNAYHKNCKNCHKAAVKEGKSKTAPYKKCTKCHEKKS
jgi:hypothetical protein